MKCEFCGAELPMNCNNCPSCGAPCKCIQPPPPPFQPQGGMAYQQVPPPQPFPGYQPKSRVAYVLLGLFLGSLGIHNFYAGYAGRGVTQLLITLFLSWLFIPWLIVELWCIIEIIAVNTDANNVKMV
ncbi:MAG: NINE protein [Lentisphaeria bacterium]|nr:NINE protein [Lentisphaeria bacterium]